MANPTHLRNKHSGVIVGYNVHAAKLPEMEPYAFPPKVAVKKAPTKKVAAKKPAAKKSA